MINTIKGTNFNLPGQTKFYKGKVRDVYTVNNETLVMVATDRISAFDHVLPQGIPFKGQVLSQIAAKFLTATADIVPNWMEATPDPSVAIGKMCEPFMVEMVIRGYLTGHAWREYKAGKRMICGVPMPDGMLENQKFDTPLLTPTTKAIVGHDEDISRDEILAQGLVAEADYIKLEEYTRAIFQRGTEIAAKKGLILVDTKYEFGKDKDGVITLIDEIHTPDSSRFWISDSYKERIAGGQEPENIDKEFLRLWFAKNCDPYNDDTLPAAPDVLVAELSARYILLYELITGEKFIFPDLNNINQRITENIKEML